MAYGNGGKRKRKVAPSKMCKPGSKSPKCKIKSKGAPMRGKTKPGKLRKAKPGPGVPPPPPKKKPVPTKYNNVRFLGNVNEGY